jgi:hypothetical protein
MTRRAAAYGIHHGPPKRQPHVSSSWSKRLRGPDHKDLRVGTLSGILKQAGVSLDEFMKNL